MRHTDAAQIVRSEFLAEPGALRVGLISYRDHPPQDHVYIVRNCASSASRAVLTDRQSGSRPTSTT